MIKNITLSTLLTYQLFALPHDKDFKLDTNNIQEEYIEKYHDMENITKHKLLEVKSLAYLLKVLNINSIDKIFNSKKIYKMINDIHINDYTLTYLLYTKVSALKYKLEPYNTNTLNIGGEYIALVHIKTNSKDDYEQTKRYLNTSNKLAQFKKNINNISNSHQVTYKSFLDKKHYFIQALNVSELIDNAKNFQTIIRSHEILYKSKKNFQNKIDQDIQTYLDLQQLYNNLIYIKNNPKQFKSKTDNNLLYEIEIYLSKYRVNYKNINIEDIKKLLDKRSYPDRYNSYISNKALKLENILFKNNLINKRYPKISNNINFTINYRFNLSKQNKGKVLVLKWDKVVTKNDKLIHKSSDSKILFDTYVNYKNLIIDSIEDNNYGSIVYKTNFNKYEKYEDIQGYGIVKQAKCGFNVLDSNGTFEIGCNNITFNDIKVKFRHKE